MKCPERKGRQFVNKHRKLKLLATPVAEQRIKTDFKKMSNLHDLSKKLLDEINQTTIHPRNSRHLRTIYKSVDLTHSTLCPTNKIEQTEPSFNFFNSWMKPTADHISKKKLTVKEHENYFDTMKPAEISSFKKQLKNINTVYVTKKKEKEVMQQRNTTVNLMRTLPLIATQLNSKRVLRSRQVVHSRNARNFFSPPKTSEAYEASSKHQIHTSTETYPAQMMDRRRSSSKLFRNTPEQGEARPTPRLQEMHCLWERLKNYIDFEKCNRHNEKRRHFKQTGQVLLIRKKRNCIREAKLKIKFEKRRCG